MEHAGISELIYKTIMSIDIHARADIYCNIIVTGASTCFPGKCDLFSLYGYDTKCHIIIFMKYVQSIGI